MRDGGARALIQHGDPVAFKQFISQNAERLKAEAKSIDSAKQLGAVRSTEAPMSNGNWSTWLGDNMG